MGSLSWVLNQRLTPAERRARRISLKNAVTIVITAVCATYVVSFVEGKTDVAAPADCVTEFFPCSTTISGNLTLIVFYGLVLMVAAKIISDGSELLLEIANPAVIGGLVLPVLGAVPDCAIILVSGLGNQPREEKQQQLNVGMGTLAGSTIMLLTLAWVGGILFGLCDIEEGEAVDERKTRTNLISSGVTVDKDVPWNAVIMGFTSLFYLVIQIPVFIHGPTNFDNQPSYVRTMALVTLIVCMLGFVGYCIFQLVSAQSHAQVERLLHRHEEERKRRVAAHAVSAVYMLSSLTQKKADGETGEIAAASAAAKWRNKAFQGSKKSLSTAPDAPDTPDAFRAPDENSTNVNTPLLSSPDVEKAIEEEEHQPKWKIALKAAVFLLIGVGMVCIFSDPMCDALTALTNKGNKEVGGSFVNISPFYVSFVVTPVCSNASELVSSLIFAAKKRKDNISLTYSQLYGAAIMNNTLCLAVFLLMVYLDKRLAWVFSAEVTAILFVVLIVTCFGLQKTYRLWQIFPIGLLYLSSIGLVAFLENYLGWE